jgi:uncharacterized protein YjbI with pentapeptide repeats
MKQADIARKRHQEQIKTDQERADADRQRRITESFSKAVEQLGSDKLEVRLGGIYTLERITREPRLEPLDYWTIMETLTGFVREQMRWKDEDTASSQAVGPRYPTDASLPPNPSPPTDIAAVLTVIKRRDARSRQREESEGWRMDLRLADLRGAQLNKAHLRGADLSGAHLEGADLSNAHLGYAKLSSAHLEGATLISTDLVWADLQSAHLEGTDFTNANLTRTNLRGAHLEGADLQDARDLIQYQLDDAFGNAETKLPEGLTRPAHWLK